MANAIAQQWASKWGATRPRREAAIKAVAAVAAAARSLAGDAAARFARDWTPVRLRARTLVFPAKTPIGLDGAPFRAVAAMPDLALHELAGLMSHCIRRLALPRQSLVNSIVALGKAKGGHRIIAIMLTF